MKYPEPQFEFVPGTIRIRLIADWIFRLEYGLQIIIPAGFETDGASVPRLFWNIMLPYGKLRYGAIPHDFFYQHGYLLSPYDANQAYNLKSHEAHHKFIGKFKYNIPVYIGESQEFGDNLFRHIAKETGAGGVQCWISYNMLSLFGGVAWSNYRIKGPDAYNSNSLNLPGVVNGVMA